MAVASKCACLIINFRLAPEHPYPAGLNDAIAGDSAGAGQAVALAQKIRDAGILRPAALALTSPWTDLTLGNSTHKSKAKLDPYFPDSTVLKAAATAYAGNASTSNPHISPQFANLAGLPPTLVHVGDREALLDDSKLKVQRMSQQSVRATLKIFPGMWHVWQTFAGKLREADTSIAEIGVLLHQHMQP